jgi:hypothetical protein
MGEGGEIPLIRLRKRAKNPPLPPASFPVFLRYARLGTLHMRAAFFKNPFEKRRVKKKFLTFILSVYILVL